MNELNLAYLLKLLMHRLYIIVISAVVVAAAAFGYCKWIATPSYSAKAQIIVSNGSLLAEENEAFPDTELYIFPEITTQDIQASIYLADKFVSVLEAQEVYSKLETVFAGKYTAAQLMNSISVSLNKQEDIFINISAKSSSKEEAIKIANTFISVAPEYLEGYFPGAQVRPTATATSAKIVFPRTARTTVIALVLGAILAYVVVLLIDMNDKTIKGDVDFTENYNIPLLGVVPDFENNESMLGGYSDEVQNS